MVLYFGQGDSELGLLLPSKLNKVKLDNVLLLLFFTFFYNVLIINVNKISMLSPDYPLQETYSSIHEPTVSLCSINFGDAKLLSLCVHRIQIGGE